MSVADLKKLLASFDDQCRVEIGGGLQLKSLKKNDEGAVVIEVQEPVAILRDDFKTRNPHVKAVFYGLDPIDESQCSPTPIWKLN